MRRDAEDWIPLVGTHGIKKFLLDLEIVGLTLLSWIQSGSIRKWCSNESSTHRHIQRISFGGFFGFRFLFRRSLDGFIGSCS